MEQEVTAPKKKHKVLKILSIILFAILFAVCGVIIFFNVTHSYYLVVGPSMIPTLNEGVVSVNESKDGVFVSKIKEYTRGDIIVLNRNYGTNEEKKDVIKRLIAIEGDKIKVSTYKGEYRIIMVYAGETEMVVLDESYLPDYSVNQVLYNNFNNMVNNMGYETDRLGFLEIPEGMIFCLGDNRENSVDSSTYGLVMREAVIGKVDYIIYNNENVIGQVIKQFFGW